MRLTKKHIRQMILQEMREPGWRKSTEYHPSQMSLDREWEAAQAEQLEKRAEAFEYFRTFTIPLIHGPIHTEAEAMELAMEKFPDIPKQGEDPGPMARSGVNVPTLDRVPMQEMRMGHPADMPPGETGYFEPEEPKKKRAPALEPMGMPKIKPGSELEGIPSGEFSRSIPPDVQPIPPDVQLKMDKIRGLGLSPYYEDEEIKIMNEGGRARRNLFREMRIVSDPAEFENPGELGDETLYYEPGVTDTPEADVVADAVEQIKDPSLLARIWRVIKAVGEVVTDEISSMDPETRAAWMSPDPIAASQGLAAAQHMRMQDDPLSEIRRARRDLLREMGEVPTSAAIADEVENIQDQGLLARIWRIIQEMGDDFGKTTSTGEFPSGYEAAQAEREQAALEYARQQRENPTGINKWLAGDAADPALEVLGTLSEGYEPGSYRAEGDRKLAEVSIGVSRWNTLAGTDK